MFKLALRHLVSRPRQTTLTLLGILFGAMSFVVISGFFLGFQTFLIDQLVNNDAHLRIYAREEFLTEHSLDKAFYGDNNRHIFWASPPAGRKDNARIESPLSWNKRLAKDPQVLAFSPQLTSQVIFNYSNTRMGGSLIGVDPEQQVKVTTITNYMVEGRFTDIASGGNRLIIGLGLKKKLGARLGQTVMVSVTSGEAVPFKIVGVFKTGARMLDDTTSYGALSDVQRVNGTPNQVNQIAVRLNDFTHAREVATAWSSTTQEKVQSWDQINESFLSIFKIQNMIRYMTTTVILVVAGFGIYNILTIVITQKKKEIAILRSMGFENSDVLRLFLFQGVILGIVGGVIGLFIGFLICKYLTTVKFGGGPAGGAGYLSISFKPRIYLYAFFFANLTAAVASFLPARAAGKLTPIQIIREGAD